MGGLGSLLFDVGASTITLQSDAARAVTISASMVNDINANLGRIGTGANFNGVSSGVQGLIGDFNNLKSVVAGVFGVGLGTGLAKEVMEYADSWQGVSNRIRTTVADAQQVDAIQRSILDVAQQTGQAVDTTAKTYQRLETVLASSGKTQADAQAQAISLTRILNQEIVVSGASTGEATRAVSDLVHGLAGGVLQARQFNPIMRQMPDLALQIAKGLGVSVAQLEEMVHKGLPAQQVLAALDKQGAEIGQRFSALPQTFARAWQQLDNSVEAYIGTAAQAGTLSDTVKAGIIGLGNNISTVADIIVVAGAATLAWLGGRTLAAINAMTTGVYQMVTAQGAYATASIKSAQADIQAATAQQAAAAATVDRVAAIAAQRDAQIGALTTTEAELQAELALGEARARSGVYSADVLAEEARLEAVRVELSAVTATLVKLEDLQDATYRRLAMSEAGVVGATTALTAAQSALTVAQTEAVSVLGLLGRGASSLFTLIGGWPTIVLGAAIATYTWANNTTDLTGSITALNQVAKQQEDQSLSLADVVRGLISGEQARKQSLEEMATAQRNVAQAELDGLKAQRDHSLAMADANGDIASSAIQWGLYEYKVHNAESAIHALDQAQVSVNFTAFTAKIANAVQTMQRMFNLVPMAAPQAPDLTKLIEGIDKETVAEAKRVATFGQGRAATVAWERDQAVATETVGLTGKALEDTTLEIFKHYDALISLAQAEDADVAAKKAQSAQTKQTTKDTKEAQVGMTELANTVNSLSGKVGGDYAKAQATYTASITKLDQEYAKAIALSSNYASAQALLKEGTALAIAQRDADVDALRNQNDASLILTNTVYQANIAFDEQTRLMGMDSTARKVEEEYTRLMSAAMKDLGDIMGPLTEDQQKMIDSLHGMAAAHVKLDEAQKVSMDATRQWVDIWANAGNSIADDLGKVLVEGESLMDDLTNVAKQTVEAIISYFAKLAIINPILDAVFGGTQGFQLLPTLGNMLGGTAGAGVTAGATNFSSTASGQTGQSLLTSGPGWISAGTKLWQGFQAGGFSGAFGNLLGIGSTAASITAGNTLSAGISAGWAGGTGLFGSGVGAATGASTGVASGASALSAFASWIPIIGLIIAGMAEDNKLFKQGWKASNGMDFSSVGSNPIAGALAPGAFVVTMDDKLLRSIGFGEQFASILTGSSVVSRLFGHQSPKLVNGTMTQEFGPDGIGGGIDANIRSKGGFFTSDKNWTEHTDLDADTLKAMQTFFDSIQKSSDAFARAFGLDAGVVASATFAQQFDKNGNPTGKTTSTIGGHTFQDETQDQFDERLQAQNFVDDLQLAGVNVTAFTDSMIDDADKWAAAVQDVAQAMSMAQQDLKNGINISGTGVGQGQFDTIQQYNTDNESETDTYTRLRSELVDVQNGIGLLTGQKSIADIEAFLATAQNFGESLSQTYSRLEQASQAYYQFTGQFKPQATYVDDYEAALSSIKTQYIANVKQANDLAKAAGAAGASTEDLTNIMQMAAKQEADALKQLQASAQSLAFSLGLTATGSLDDVNSEIARLQQQAGQGATAISNVGNAMQTMAQQATDAINLMLGDLSPYNDKAKLQIALQGLYAGTATKDQVLSIAKSLWTTTSSQYQALFNQVMAVPAHGTGGGGGGGGAAHQGLSAADSQRLQDLLKEQQTLQAAATIQQYQTLAQQVAEIASSKGEDWKQVLTDMNVDISAFEKGLGMTDDQTNNYIQAAQDEKDSNKENTASIVFWLQKIFEQGGGTIEVTVNTPDSGGTGHSSHGRPMLANPRFNRGPGGQPARNMAVVPGM